MARPWHLIRMDAIQSIRENDNLSEIEKGPAEDLVRKHFSLMMETIGNLELVRRRAEKDELDHWEPPRNFF